jgi:hypothetical protein
VRRRSIATCKQFKESKDRPEPERRSSRLTASKSDDKQYYVDDGDDSDVEVQNMTVSSTEDRTSSASAAAVSDGTASARNRSQKSEAAASNVRCMDVAERKVAVGGGLVAVTSIAEERAADDGVVTVRSEVSSERRRGTDQAATPADSTVLNGGGQVTAARRAQGLSGADGETSVKPTSLLPLNGGTCKVVLNKIKHEWVDLSKFPVDRRVTVGKNASVEKSSAQFVPGEENDGTSAAREAPEADASRNKSETAEATDVVEDNASSDVAGEKPVADTNTTKSETAEATDVVEDNASSDVAGKKPDADTNTTKSETAEATDVVEDNASSDVAGKKPDADTNTTKSETVVATDVVEDNASSDVARETSDTIEMTLSDENAASRINETLSEARNGAADGIRIPADGDRRTGEETGERSGSLSPTAGLLAISDDVNHENNTLVAPCPVAEAGMSSLIGNDGVGDDARRVEPLTGVNHENNTPVAPCPVAEAGMSSLIGNDGVSDDARRVEPLTGDAAVTVKQEVPVDVACENAVENEDLSVSSNRLSAVRDATGSAGRWVFEAIKSMVDDMATTDHRTSGDDCAAGLKGLASFEPLTNNASGVDCSEDGPLSLMLSDDEPISTGLSTQSGSSDVVGCPDMGTD